MFTRRKFLSSKLMVFALTLFPDFLISSPIVVSVRTGLPRPMSLEEFNREQLGFVDLAAMRSLLQRFRIQGKIFGEEPFEISDTQAVWHLTFKSREAFEEWDRIVGSERIVDDAARIRLGFSIDKSVRYI